MMYSATLGWVPGNCADSGCQVQEVCTQSRMPYTMTLTIDSPLPACRRLCRPRLPSAKKLTRCGVQNVCKLLSA